jgi:hypothetical protein
MKYLKSFSDINSKVKKITYKKYSKKNQVYYTIHQNQNLHGLKRSNLV